MSLSLYQNSGALLHDTEWGCLKQICHGIEKEGLRVTPEGQIAITKHPKSLGASLTHPYITTDYSEALLEFITPVFEKIDTALDFLEQLHQFCFSVLENHEIIWATSMPTAIDPSLKIPIADYGSSNVGTMKRIYRKGLSHRYGDFMQVIAGIHYNFSLSDEFWRKIQNITNQDSKSLQEVRSEGYFGLIRNFRRYAWLLTYLFGASPVLDKTFLAKQANHSLKVFDDHSYFNPWATSLRMSDLGYTNDAQSTLDINYNSLTKYVKTLGKAITTPYKPFEKIGIFQSNGDYKQLNANILQIENEYYSTIRPKRIIKKQETPLTALAARGVEYIEVRCLDINPFFPTGIDQDTANFVDAFLLFCVFADSPLFEKRDVKQLNYNFSQCVDHGRKPNCKLKRNNKGITLKDWGLELIEHIEVTACILDDIHNTNSYTSALLLQKAKLDDAEKTPSAQVLSYMRQHKVTFQEFSLALSLKHQSYFQSKQMVKERIDYFQTLSKESLLDQKVLEESDDIDFTSYLNNYFKRVTH